MTIPIPDQPTPKWGIMTASTEEQISYAAKNALSAYDQCSTGGGHRDTTLNQFVQAAGGYPVETSNRARAFTSLRFGWDNGRDALEQALLNFPHGE